MKKFIVLCLTSVLNVPAAFAVGSGGYENQTPHARAMGRANLGAASANDSSASFFNPALLTRAGSEVTIGSTFQDLTSDYNGGAAGNDSLEQGMSVSPNFHASSRLENHPFAFGISVLAPYGLATDWSEDGPLRYVATKTDLAVVSVSPAIGVALSPAFSLGFGVDYYTISELDLQRKVNVTNLNFALGGAGTSAPDANQTLSGDGDDVGVAFGAHWEATERDMFGFSYRTGANIPVKGDVELNGLSNESAFVFGGTDYKTGAESELVIPASAQFGYARRFGSTLVEVGAQWNEWSEFREQTVRFNESDPTRAAVLNAGAVTPKQWRDAWSGGVGIETPIRSLTFRAGWAFFDSPVPDSTFEPSTPDSDLHMFTLGLGVPLGESFVIDVAGQYYVLNDRKVDNDVGAADLTSVDGTYESSAIYGAINLTYRWGRKAS